MAKPYRRGVGVVLLNATGKNRGRVFVAQRIDTKEPAWQMPQGGIDDGETPRQAAMRELHEEIGTDKARIVGVTPHWLTYDLPADLQNKVWKGKYRGQKQKWFLMRFTGVDADINLDTDHPEFSTWKWLPLTHLPRVIVGFKRDIYKQVVAAFRDKVAAMKRPVKKKVAKKKAVKKKAAKKKSAPKRARKFSRSESSR
jgi:putative (di)nucleoside polyphosphate hydrolase